jgi:hypothetical protein
MGSCCGKGEQYGGSRAVEPSAWQLATMDDFYDSETGDAHGDLHDEHGMVELQPSSYHTSRVETMRHTDHTGDDDNQFVTLDFNLAPRHPTPLRPSYLRSSNTSVGSSRDATEGLVLPGLAERNELRGSGSFTISSRTPSHHSDSSPPTDLPSPGTRRKDVSTSESAAPLDQTVIIRNSESVYSYTYEDSNAQNSRASASLGGVLSGEDDEDSVASPLVSGTPARTSPSPAQRTTPVSSPQKPTRNKADSRYLVLALEDEDSTIYEDAVSEDPTVLAS